MSNWSSNNLVVKPEMLKHILNTKDEVDFEVISPCPPRLSLVSQEGTSPSGLIWNTSGQPVSLEEQKELLSLYGSDHWYAWHNNAWGTKWNVSSSSRFNCTAPEFIGKVSLMFDTAWSPPEPWVEKLSSLYPEDVITLFADIEGGGFYRLTYQDGTLISEEELEREEDEDDE